MKAAFALLVDADVQNVVRAVVWEIHRKYRTDIDVARLPQHVSLKQPFEITALGPVEQYMSELAASVAPLELHLTHLEIVPARVENVDSAILWMDVEQTAALQSLQARLNDELASRFVNTAADYDGATYHFHLTLMIGGQPLSIYQKIHPEYSHRLADLRADARQLAMFIYDERDSLNAAYMLYKILPLAGAQ